MSRDRSSPDPREPLSAWDALRRPVWLFDPRTLRGIYANCAALRLWGASSVEELLSRDFSKLSPAVRTRTTRLAQATANGEAVNERWTFYPNGEPVTVQATISTYWLADGRAVLMFEASTAEVEASERRAIEALRHTSTLITLFDRHGMPIFSNPAAYSAYGSGDRQFEARFADPERGPAMLAQALGGETVGEVCEVVTSNGQRWHHLDARPVLDPVTGASGVLLNERDVTQRVQAELARAAAEQKASMAEARQRFLTEMSHELRTPLNTVIGFSELLMAAELSPADIEQARRINGSGKQLLSVVNEMIRFSQSDGWTGLRPEPMSLESGPAAARVTSKSAPERSLRVLYVDDNDNNRALVTAILASQGIQCVTANDGAQGVEAARSGDWDVILMDIQMPVMTGVEASRAIRASAGSARSVPIIAVTANTLDVQLEAYASAGMDDFIAKPVDVFNLIAKVTHWSAVDHEPGEKTCHIS